MRVLAALCCALAAGCSTSLDVTVPGPVSFEQRATRPATAAAPVARLELQVARRALSRTAVARQWSETARTGEFRRMQPRLSYAIPYSYLIEYAEFVVSAALVPPLVPVLLYQLVWWIWSRGLTDAERAELDPPWGSGYRDASLQAIWPGCNVTAWWAWRAELLPLEGPGAGGWRVRTVRDATPLPDPIELRVGGGASRSAPAEGGRARWSLAELPAGDGGALTLTATSRAGTATLELPAGYLRDATEAAALRAKLAADPADAAGRARLAALYEAAGGFAQARGEWEQLAAADTDDHARAIDRLWGAEAAAHRAAGQARRALFADAVRPLEAARLAGHSPTEPLEAAPEAAAGRLTRGLLVERVQTALAWAASDTAPPSAVARALLSVAGDHTAPVAAWAALRACVVHPQPLAAEVLPLLLAADAPDELHRLAARAVVVGAPGRALASLAPFAHRPGVAWVLNDVTGAGLDPVPNAWAAWLESEAPRRQWDASARRYLPRRDR